MKQTSTQRVRVSLRLCLGLFLTTLSLMFSKTSSAHNVLYYTPPCFVQSTTTTTFTVPVFVANAGSGSYFHWQYKLAGATSWTYFPTNSSVLTVGTAKFTVTNASYVLNSNANGGSGALLAPPLTFTNTTAFTTQLDGMQLRVLMTDGQDPATHPYPTIAVYGAAEYSNGFEAKYVTLQSIPSISTPCSVVCPSNALTTDRLSTNPALETFYGGFEVPGTGNFVAANGSTGATIAATALTQWTTGTTTSSLANKYRIINNADSIVDDFADFAPHSGRQMMVVMRNSVPTSLVWQRTIVTNGSQHYSGVLNISAYFARVDNVSSTIPAVTIEIKGATSPTGTLNSTVLASSNATISGAVGTWQRVTLSFTIPANTNYQKLQFAIRSTNTNTGTNAVSFAIDDICLSEPAAGTLPIVLTPLKGTYANGVSNLTWSTLQESNSSRFDIERSSDGINFTVIGNTAAKGVSDKQTNYAFNDIKVNPGTNYYRLKLVDKDGLFQYSNIVALNVNLKGTNVTGIYPNPFTDRVNIAVSSDVNAQASISLFDNTGKLLARQMSTINKGANNVVLQNLDNLAKGFYLIKVQVGEVVTTQKLIK